MHTIRAKRCARHFAEFFARVNVLQNDAFEAGKLLVPILEQVGHLAAHALHRHGCEKEGAQKVVCAKQARATLFSNF